MKVLFDFRMTRTQVLHALKTLPKQAIENSLLSYHLSQCSDGPTNPQYQPGRNDADAADDDGRPRSRKS